MMFYGTAASDKLVMRLSPGSNRYVIRVILMCLASDVDLIDAS